MLTALITLLISGVLFIIVRFLCEDPQYQIARKQRRSKNQDIRASRDEN